MRRHRVLVMVTALAICGWVDPSSSATFVVNDTSVGPAETDLGDGICMTTAGTCTFHAAQREAEAFPGADEIIVPAGQWNPLSIVTEDVHIIGVGSGTTAATVFNGGAAGSEFFVGAVFIVQPAVNFQLTGVTVENGHGGIHTEGLVTVTDSLFRDHLARAAIWCDSSLAQIQVTSSRFDNNDDSAIRCGQAIDIADSEFTNNRTQGGGGAISAQGPLTIIRSTFSLNAATNTAGAVDADGVTSIEDSTFILNTSGNVGGAISGDGTINISGSTFFRNTASNVGGAVGSDGTLNVVNSTFADNRASNTGSTFHVDAEATLNNVTIFSVSGTAIKIDGSVTLSNTILEAGVAVCGGTLESAGNNIFFGDMTNCTVTGDTASDQVGADPLLGGLLDNGGPTTTQAIPAGSPAIDAGGDDCESHDQRGIPRPLGGGCDVGAYERIPCDLDSVVEPGEQCDDGNLDDGDGCSSICQTELVTGRSLALAADPSDPARSRLVFQSKDPFVSLGFGNGSKDDPVLHGGVVRVASTNGDGFDDTYVLPASGWRYIGKPGQNRGYKYKDPSGTIRLVKVRPAKGVKVKGKGSGLGHSLGASPNPVVVSVTIGTRLHQAAFGGTVKFKADTRYRGKNAARPGSMTP